MTALTADQEAYAAARVAAGDFGCVQDVVFAAFQLLKGRDSAEARLHYLRADLDLGLAQLDSGRTSTRTAQEILDSVRARATGETCAN